MKILLIVCVLLVAFACPSPALADGNVENPVVAPGNVENPLTHDGNVENPLTALISDILSIFE